MEIKQARERDLNLILEYLGKRTSNRKNWHIQSKKFISSYIKNKNNFFFITLKDKKVVGTINGELWIDKGFAYIGEVSYKGKDKEKIINEMFNYFKEFCKKKKIKLINSYVNKKNKEIIKNYRLLNMKKTGEYIGFEKIIEKKW